MTTSIVLTGPESTGKTWLSGLLASAFETSWRPEYLREFYDKYSGIKKHQMETVARRQTNQEKELLKLHTPLVFFDTNIISLKVYYQYYFQETPIWFEELYQPELYTHYFLLDTNGVKWVEDPQRDSPETREKLYGLFKAELDFLKLPYTILTGNYQNRFVTATAEVKHLLELPKTS